MAHLHQKKQHPFLCNTPFLLQSLHKPIAAKNQLTCLLQQTDITCKFRRQTCAVGERGAEAEAAAAALVEPRVQVLHHQPTSSRSKMSCWSKSSSSPCPGRLSHATAAGARGLEEVLEDEERAIERRRRSSRSGGGARERGAGHRAPPTQPARHELYRKGDPFPLDLLVRTESSGKTRGRRRPTCSAATE